MTSRVCSRGMSRGHIPKALREEVPMGARRRCDYCLTSARVTGTPMEPAFCNLRYAGNYPNGQRAVRLRREMQS